METIQLERRDATRAQEDDGQEVMNDNVSRNQQHAIQSLEPVDGGIVAWRVLIAAFIFEALLWGSCEILFILINI